MVDKKFLLTVGIPTYNRSEKLDRLLCIISKQLNDENLADKIEILVSDNCSIDNTNLVIKKHHRVIKHFKYQEHESNLGFDLNILSIYKNIKSEYVWFLADDDIPISGSLTKIYNALTLMSPDILLFSFGQPPASRKGVYQFEEEIYLSKTIIESIELVMRWPKVSVYVFRCIEFSDRLLNIIDKHNGDGWNHVVLGLSILYSKPKSKVNIISEVLAHCDEDFDMLTWSPKAIQNSYRLANHPLIQETSPQLLNKLKFGSYVNSIQFCFAAKIGSLRVLNMNDYDDFIKTIPWKIVYLLKNPKSLIQLFLLKLKITSMYPKKTQSY